MNNTRTSRPPRAAASYLDLPVDDATSHRVGRQSVERMAQQEKPLGMLGGWQKAMKMCLNMKIDIWRHWRAGAMRFADCRLVLRQSQRVFANPVHA
ncbi:MAG: hypothetical protein M3Q16_08420 [Pseudomonadota bacterium]|nr:hypothetical protein [Pseudomonadota bacterium]